MRSISSFAWLLTCLTLSIYQAVVQAQGPQAPANAEQPSPTDPAGLLRMAATLNRLDYPGAQPWHLKATYEVLDSEGHKVDRGTYEVFWAAPNKFKQSFASKKCSLTLGRLIPVAPTV